MIFPGKVVTRVLRFTLQKVNINRTQRISSIVLTKPWYDLDFFNKVKKASGVCKRLLEINTHSVVFTRAMGALSPLDPSSYSRPELAIVKHISLSLDVDFARKVLCGVATLNIEVLDNVSEVILDSSKLNIESVETDDGKSLTYTIGDEVPHYGSKLTIALGQVQRPGTKWIKVECPSVRIQEAKNHLNLTYTGFIYKPDIYGFLEQVKDVYVTETENQFPPCKNREISEWSVKSDGSDQLSEEINFEVQKKFGKTNVLAQRGEVLLLEAHGSEDCVTPIGESNSVPPDCAKQIEIEENPVPEENLTLTDRQKEISFYVDNKMSYSCIVPPMHELADASCKPLTKVTLKIKYSTSPEASALQWLDPNQTSGKTLPFMFSQCQPIHARSILPCQDTPAVKFTYDAVVSAPPQFTVLMSALRSDDVADNKTSFRQPMPLPSYLVAIAVGELDSKSLGPRSKVWSEKESLAKSAWEFADTEKYLQAAENLCGSYQWTQYDLLVLPPSFPYGGMENPCLTFVTPTLLAGDKSLADVIVHEIMHSWTGNLVTNRNFEHFWLNEGFTVYLERKVTASLVKDPEEAKKTRDFHSILGLQELSEAVETLGVESPLTVLVPDLETVHPDDSFSRVPYEKGSLFLRYLEDILGGPEVFDDFLRAYLNNYSKKSLDTTDFKSFLYKYFKGDDRLDQVDWDTWLSKPGMPPVIPQYDTSMTKCVDELAERVTGNHTFAISDVQNFIPQQMIYFLQKLVDGPALTPSALQNLESEYKLREHMNAEIRFRLMRLSIRSQDQSRLEDVFKFVNTQGRMKYVRPIYRDLYAWEYARELAIANFLKNEKNMMHVSAYTLRKDLHLSD